MDTLSTIVGDQPHTKGSSHTVYNNWRPAIFLLPTLTIYTQHATLPCYLLAGVDMWYAIMAGEV